MSTTTRESELVVVHIKIESDLFSYFYYNVVIYCGIVHMLMILSVESASIAQSFGK